MSTGTILTLHGYTTPAYITFTLNKMSMDKKFLHDGTFTAIVTKLGQLAQSTGFVTPANPLIGHSPNVTLEFIVEVLYPEGMGPDLSNSFEYFRQLALVKINADFGLSLT